MFEQPATNYDSSQAITCNEFGLVLRHRAVRKNTHAGHDINRQPTDSAITGMQRIQTASKRSRAMNYSCCCAIVRSEETHTLATTYPATNYIDLRIT